MSRERASWPMKSHEVLAILEGRKTQHRVLVKPQPPAGHKFQGWQIDSTGSQKDNGKAAWAAGEGVLMQDVVRLRSPYGRAGDKIWGREDTCKRPLLGIISGEPIKGHDCGAYKADGSDVLTKEDFDIVWWGNNKTCPAIFMPRYASRITLEITGVRVERLQDISEADAIAEGLMPVQTDYMRKYTPDRVGYLGQKIGSCCEPRLAYMQLWDSINGTSSWDVNPWVWVYEFRKI